MAKYGVEGNRIRGGGNREYGWWKDLCGVGEGVGMAYEWWFDDGWQLKLHMVKIPHFGSITGWNEVNFSLDLVKFLTFL